MSLAAATRDAVDEYPFLVDALRAGICNYTAAARFLDVDGEVDAVATALRRYGEALTEYETASRDVRVTMESGIEPVEEPDAALLQVGEIALGPGRGDQTAIVATGEIDASGVAGAMARCRVDGIDLDAVSFVAGSTAAFVVSRRDGANALRGIENSFDAVPGDAE
ncbi:hypothetical protein Halru_1364 [Halovivax ruber XH-70]|uniref:Uncharacterized protein n=1 Tax=Halovivax ruber (strain DSM 18193 / JCM 13892 / XH-70) TaxID=797302 RepID=L0IDD6_HALRX|nr:hypothetical protein [Halovivax ruber]AGB15977.1 hypothetical protein Halru_1364 [Halovivax ruber XH-70]